MISKQLIGINKKEHARVVSILTLMVNDALKGVPKYEIKQKFIKGDYGDSLKKDNVKYRADKFYEYWVKMQEEFADELNEPKELIKATLLAKYNSLYKKSLEKEDLKNAKAILDSLKSLVIDDNKKISLETDNNSKINISFGFN